MRAVSRVHVGVGRAGMDHVGGDAARAEIPGEALRHAGQRRLRHRVDGHAGPAGAVGEAAADRHDRAAVVAHPRRGGLGGEEAAADVDREHPVQARRVELLERAGVPDPGVVDEQVEAAQLLRRAGDRRHDRVAVAVVGLDRQRPRRPSAAICATTSSARSGRLT